MAQVIPFFPKGSIVFGSTASKDFISEVFEVPEYSQLIAEFRIYALVSGTSPNVTGIIEHTTDPSLDKWSTLTSGVLSAEGVSGLNPSASPYRYVRGKFTVSAASGTTIAYGSLIGVAREST
jgi:hypothetical protein